MCHRWRESLTPSIVTSQDSDAIRKKLMSHGIRLGANFVLQQRSKHYVSRKFFFEYINTICVSYLNKSQESEEFEACEAVLVMDNCSPHVSNDVVAVLFSVRTRIITFIYDTTQVFQMLDVVLFGALKKHAPRLKSLDEGNQPPLSFSRSIRTSNRR
jgi:hypothetical protein